MAEYAVPFFYMSSPPLPSPIRNFPRPVLRERIKGEGGAPVTILLQLNDYSMTFCAYQSCIFVTDFLTHKKFRRMPKIRLKSRQRTNNMKTILLILFMVSSVGLFAQPKQTKEINLTSVLKKRYKQGETFIKSIGDGVKIYAVIKKGEKKRIVFRDKHGNVIATDDPVGVAPGHGCTVCRSDKGPLVGGNSCVNMDCNIAREWNWRSME
jgi:hypothetical protein